MTSITDTDSLLGCCIRNRDTNSNLNNLTGTFLFDDAILHYQHERKLKHFLTSLESFNIPNSLVDGDFHKMNVIDDGS